MSNQRKAKSFVYPIIWTGIISLTMIIICAYLLYSNKDSIFKWEDPTSELRNVILGIAAIGGIPFLILGHINRRLDLDSKEKDLLLKTESTTNETILKQLKDASIILIELNADALGQNKRVIYKKETLLSYFEKQWIGKEFIYLRETHELINNLELNIKTWTQLTRNVSVICNSLRLKNQYKNQELKNLISIQLISNLSEEHLKLVLYIALVDEFGQIEPKTGRKSNTQVLMNEISILNELNMISDVWKTNLIALKDKFLGSEGLLRGRER